MNRHSGGQFRFGEGGSGAGSLVSRAYLYNAAGERTYTVSSSGAITAYRYDAAGWLTGVSYPFTNGIVASDLATRASLGLLGAGGQGDSRGSFGDGLPGTGGSAGHAGSGRSFHLPQLPDHGAFGYDRQSLAQELRGLVQLTDRKSNRRSSANAGRQGRENAVGRSLSRLARMVIPIALPTAVMNECILWKLARPPCDTTASGT